MCRHPNEKSKNLATIPVLGRCLRDMTVVHARRLTQAFKVSSRVGHSVLKRWCMRDGSPRRSR